MTDPNAKDESAPDQLEAPAPCEHENPYRFSDFDAHSTWWCRTCGALATEYDRRPTKDGTPWEETPLWTHIPAREQQVLESPEVSNEGRCPACYGTLAAYNGSNVCWRCYWDVRR